MKLTQQEEILQSTIILDKNYCFCYQKVKIITVFVITSVVPIQFPKKIIIKDFPKTRKKQLGTSCLTVAFGIRPIAKIRRNTVIFWRHFPFFLSVSSKHRCFPLLNHRSSTVSRKIITKGFPKIRKEQLVFGCLTVAFGIDVIAKTRRDTVIFWRHLLDFSYQLVANIAVCPSATLIVIQLAEQRIIKGLPKIRKNHWLSNCGWLFFSVSRRLFNSSRSVSHVGALEQPFLRNVSQFSPTAEIYRPFLSSFLIFHCPNFYFHCIFSPVRSYHIVIFQGKKSRC